MSSIAPTSSANLLAVSQIVPQPLLPADTTLDRNETYFELENASILAASIGLGVHFDATA
jgi:hypothetical protein